MASREMVSSMITYFCGLWPTKTKSEDLVEAYHRAFRAYTDEQISNAGDQAMQEMEFFPKPVDIIRRILQEATDSGGTIGYEVHKCQECGAVKHAIEDPKGCGVWKCRPCYTGLNDQEIADRFNAIYKALGGKFKFPTKEKNKLDRGLVGKKIIEVDHITEANRVQELKRQAAIITAPGYSEVEISDDDIPF